MKKEEFLKQLREIDKKKIKAYQVYQKELADAWRFEASLINKYARKGGKANNEK